jgi:inosine/xanthosine triphosphate pyrophosphatase family protein
LTEPRGDGFGYDPVFWIREANSTYAQLPAHQKMKLGSRGKAIRAIATEMGFLMGF